MTKTIAIVPMRHHSQRVPGKNYRHLGSKHLYQYVLDTLIDSNVDIIIVDTDSDTIKEGIEKIYDQKIYDRKIIVVRRPDELCSPHISMNKIIKSIIDRYRNIFDDNSNILQTHVTNPFISVETINGAIQKFKQETPDTLMTVTSFQKRLWESDGTPVNHNPNVLIQTQDLKTLYEENSCLYIFNVKSFLKTNNRLGPNRLFYPMTQMESWDIDTEEDFEMARIILKYKSIPINQSISIEQTSEVSEKINHQLFEQLHNRLKKEVNALQSIDLSEKRVLISAPYMMSEINTFKHFYQSIGIKVIVADVKERLNENDLAKYRMSYDVAVIGDDAYTRNALIESGVKAICKWGTGIDSIDQEACSELNIPLYNTPNAFSVPVSQSIIATILGFLRQTFQSDQLMTGTDQWVKLPGKTLEEVTIGIIGLGNIGKQLTGYLKHFGTKIIGYDIRDVDHIDGLEKVNLETLFSHADVVCTCCTLEPSSHHIINKDSLKLMKRGVYLINMARGNLVEEKAIVEALQNGHVAGLALDVFEQEPLSVDSPLRKIKNVILSSHNSNSSPKYWLNVHINTIRNSLISFKEISTK